MSKQPMNPRYVIVRAATTHLLVAEVDPKLADGVWQCVGAPFYDKDRGDWCQTLSRSEQPGASAPAGRTVKLRGL